MKARLLTIAACAMMGRRQRRARALGARRRRDVLPRRPRAAMPGGRLPMPPRVVLRHALYILRRRAGHNLARRARRQVEEARHHQLNIRRQTPTPLSRYHHDAQFFLLNCRLSDMIIDSNIAYAYSDKVLDPAPGASALTTTDARAKGGRRGGSRTISTARRAPRRSTP